MPEATQKNQCIEGEIIYIDHFGNATTNMSLELIEKTYSSTDTIEISAGKEKINGLQAITFDEEGASDAQNIAAPPKQEICKIRCFG